MARFIHVSTQKQTSVKIEDFKALTPFQRSVILLLEAILKAVKDPMED